MQAKAQALPMEENLAILKAVDKLLAKRGVKRERSGMVDRALGQGVARLVVRAEQRLPGAEKLLSRLLHEPEFSGNFCIRLGIRELERAARDLKACLK
jgi:hypothetical protein